MDERVQMPINRVQNVQSAEKTILSKLTTLLLEWKPCCKRETFLLRFRTVNGKQTRNYLKEYHKYSVLLTIKIDGFLTARFMHPVTVIAIGAHFNIKRIHHSYAVVRTFSQASITPPIVVYPSAIFSPMYSPVYRRLLPVVLAKYLPVKCD